MSPSLNPSLSQDVEAMENRIEAPLPAPEEAQESVKTLESVLSQQITLVSEAEEAAEVEREAAQALETAAILPAPVVWMTTDPRAENAEVQALEATEPPLSEAELQSILEALFFCASHPLSVRQLGEILGLDGRKIRKLAEGLNQHYEASGRAFRLQEVAGGWQLRTEAHFRPWIQKLDPIKPIKLSLPTVETLAIIAYKQPVTRADVEFIRGVDSSYTIRTLLQKKLIKIMGKEAIPGRPILYGTSKLFLEIFGLKDIHSLPTLADLNLLEPQDSSPAPAIQASEAEALLPTNPLPN